MNIQNIFWDVDGTLCDTYPAITYAISRTLNELGISAALNMIDGLARESVENCLAVLSERFQLDPGRLHRRFTEVYEEIPQANQIPFPGVKKVCAWIQAHGGRNVITTHRRLGPTQKLLDVHGLSTHFAGILSVEMGYPRKPDPTILEAAVQHFRMDRSATWIVGNRLHDIQAGQAAGIHTCYFGVGQHYIPAELQVKTYHQLLANLNEEPTGNKLDM